MRWSMVLQYRRKDETRQCLGYSGYVCKKIAPVMVYRGYFCYVKPAYFLLAAFLRVAFLLVAFLFVAFLFVAFLFVAFLRVAFLFVAFFFFFPPRTILAQEMSPLLSIK